MTTKNLSAILYKSKGKWTVGNTFSKVLKLWKSLHKKVYTKTLEKLTQLFQTQIFISFFVRQKSDDELKHLV